MDMLFLADAKLNDFDQTVTVPVVDDWSWEISGDGTGYLLSPDNTKYCNFNIMAGTIQMSPDDSVTQVPGLSLSVVQEMGEQYMDDVLFSEAKRADFSNYVEARNEQAKSRKKEIYESIKGNITLSYDGHGNWKTLVDTQKIKDLSGIESEPVLMSKEQGIELFNKVAETKMTNSSLKDPCGYMKASDNLYDFIHSEYQGQYSRALNSIEDGYIEATGYAVQSVLNNLTKTVRSDVTKQVVPKGEKYGDLRFVTPTDEQKKCVKQMVKSRLALTLIYEKKRGYDDATINKRTQELKNNCRKLQESIYNSQPTKEQTQDTSMTM